MSLTMLTVDSISVSMRRCREKKGWSIKVLSEKSGVPYSTLCNAESGRNVPSIFVLMDCSGALGISIEEYIGAE